MFHITLKEVRESSGYSAEKAAEKLGILIEVYNNYENDPGQIPKVVACKIRRMYGISLDSLCIGVIAYAFLLLNASHLSMN